MIAAFMGSDLLVFNGVLCLEHASASDLKELHEAVTTRTVVRDLH